MQKKCLPNKTCPGVHLLSMRTVHNYPWEQWKNPTWHNSDEEKGPFGKPPMKDGAHELFPLPAGWSLEDWKTPHLPQAFPWLTAGAENKLGHSHCHQQP